MATKFPTPDDLSLDEIQQRFSTDENAREYLESIRWPHGPSCPHCKNDDKERMWAIVPNKEKKIRAGLRQCQECRKQFTVTVGTIFEDSHVPLRKWLVAWYLMNSSKKGISALQIQRMLGLGSYRTAHFMMHRIRFALQDNTLQKKLAGTVEIDETYVGGKPRMTFVGGKQVNIISPKSPVVSLVERDGRKHSMAVEKITAKGLKNAIKQHVAAHSTVVTDESPLYKKLSKDKDFPITHHTIHHATRQYALKYNEDFTIHTNTAESSFSLLKRGIIGTFHHVSKQHLGLYLAEFDHRWNTKKATDGKRMVEGLKKAEGKRLTYRKPKASKSATVQNDEGSSDSTKHLV